MEKLKELLTELKEKVLTQEQVEELWDTDTGNSDDNRDSGQDIAESDMAKKIILIIEYFITTHSGLWCTDRPDVLTKDLIQKYFWELK